MRKCGDVPFKHGVCKPPVSSVDCFTKLYFLPDPQPDKNRPGHFLPFEQLKGQNTTESCCPSLLRRMEWQASGAPPGLLVGQRLRSTISCDECQKPRGIFSQHALSPNQKKELESLKEVVQYTCGSPITTEGSVLHRKVYVQTNMRCLDHIEFTYYACPRRQPSICCYCASPNAVRDQQALEKYKVILPVCANCTQKPTIARQDNKAKKK